MAKLEERGLVAVVPGPGSVEPAGSHPPITVVHLPEGVWLAYSDSLPGLIVETDTRDEAINLSRDMAIELMEMRGEKPDRQRQHFAFIFEE
jgi:hypothetical protein